jgi:hypothetical protein
MQDMYQKSNAKQTFGIRFALINAKFGNGLKQAESQIKRWAR